MVGVVGTPNTMVRPMSRRPRIPVRTPRRQLLVAAMALLGAGVLGAPAAGADPSRPGGTASVLDSISPAAGGVSLQVLGGDSFLELEVDPGTEAVVLGYQDEPYLRVLDDGTVQHNVRSPAVTANTDRLGGTTDPTADPTAEPQWETTGTDGRVAWHDHRIHWMGESDPAAAPDGVIQTWDVKLVVDGRDTTVTGRLLLVDAGFPWAIPVAILVAIAVGLGARRFTLQAALAAGAGAVAVVVTVGWWLENPPEAGGFPWGLLLAAGAIVCSAVAPVVDRRGGRRSATNLLIAAVALLSGWWIGRVTVLWAAVVPTVLPTWVDRLGTALVCGVTVGLAAALVLGTATLPGRADPGVSAEGS